MENKHYDFVAIGDIVTDAFIRIKDAAVHCNVKDDSCELCVRYGDKVPFEDVHVIKAVGNSANAAVSASRLGVSSALIATVGNDENGKDCLNELKKNNVSTEYMKVNNDFPTNYHYVLWYEVERTILVKHAPFPYSLPENMLAPKWIYLSSMGENSTQYHHEIATYLKNHPETKLAFQPGTFQMKLGTDALRDVYQETDVFFCNVEEAQRILKTPDEHDKLTLMKGLMDLGPKLVAMTDGINGAYTYDGENAYFIGIYPHTPYERTGAGDAFASTFTVALLLGKTKEEALTWGPINSMSVVQHIGAQEGLLSKDRLEHYLKDAPLDYKIKKIN